MLIQLTLGARGTEPYVMKNLYIALIPTKFNYSCPLLSVRDWSRTLADTKTRRHSSPYIKWCRTMDTVSPSHMRIPNHGSKLLFSICSWLYLRMQNSGIWRVDCIFIEKKPLYKWTYTVQTHVVQGSTVTLFNVNQYKEVIK